MGFFFVRGGLPLCTKGSPFGTEGVDLRMGGSSPKSLWAIALIAPPPTVLTSMAPSTQRAGSVIVSNF